jgi:hypothetical protein
MSRRPPQVPPAGYDKYYLPVDCSGCGRWTGKEYAYRFGETEPMVWCISCTRMREQQRKKEEKIQRRGHKKNIRCEMCYTVIRTEKYHSDSDTEYEKCLSCIEDFWYESPNEASLQEGPNLSEEMQVNDHLTEVHDEKLTLTGDIKKEILSNEQIIDNQFMYD